LLGSPMHLDHVLFRETQRSATDIELVWDTFNEVLFIYGSVAQLAGIWAFALGGTKQKGAAWRIEYSGSWIECQPQEMPCFPWLKSYTEAQPWFSSLHQSIRAYWDKGLTASMVINHFLYNTEKKTVNASLLAAWCQGFMKEKMWDELFIALSQDDVTLQRELSQRGRIGWPLADDFDNAKAKIQALQHPTLPFPSGCKQQPIKNNVQQLNPRLGHRKSRRSECHKAQILNFPRQCKILLNPISEKLPLPPFQASAEITPINKLAELAMNADYMGYSAKSYLYRIIDGFYYLYHVKTEYGQATLGLVQRNNRWFGDFIVGQDGENVSKKVKDIAIEWLYINGSRFILDQ